MDGVDDRLEEHKAFRRQADTSPNDNAVVVCGGQLTFHRLHRHFIRTNEAQVTLPAPVCTCFNASVMLARIFSAFMPGGKAGSE